MEFEFADDEIVSIKEVTQLYESVDWVIYATDPDGLARAVDRSTYVVTARDDQGVLVGLARCLSDDVSIMYLQDVLVRPEHQNAGVGSHLVTACLQKFAHVRQKVLLTDNEERLRSFYNKLGYSDVASLDPTNLVAFVQIKGVDLT